MRTTIFLLLALLSFYLTQAQKNELPKGWLQEIESFSPNMYRFSGKKLTLKTDRILNYGFEYTMICRVNWVNDSTFSLTPKRHYRKNNNLARSRRKKARDPWRFQLNERSHWCFVKGEGKNYFLRSIDKGTDAEDKKPLEIKLIPLKQLE